MIREQRRSLRRDEMAAPGRYDRLATQMLKLYLQSCIRVPDVMRFFRRCSERRRCSPERAQPACWIRLLDDSGCALCSCVTQTSRHKPEIHFHMSVLCQDHYYNYQYHQPPVTERPAPLGKLEFWMGKIKFVKRNLAFICFALMI